MFKSFEQIEYLGVVLYDGIETANLKYKLIDDDFEKTIVVAGQAGTSGQMRTIIDIYEERDLTVPQIAENLMKAILYLSKEHRWKINDIIGLSHTYNEKFAKYEYDLGRYMILI